MLTLLPIERRTGLTRTEFMENYLKPRKPVVFTDLSKDWAATQKWTFEYLAETYGDLDVPVVDPSYHIPGANYMKSHLTMKFGDYLRLIQQGPSELRIFLWNIMEHAKGLTNDVSLPTICDGWADKYPFMFFGGAGAVTGMHYDIDCSHVFHTHFLTRKRVVLFAPEQGPFLYQHPFTVQSAVNPLEPDYKKYPALQNLTGYETTLTHGETLFIPTHWWHYIVYLDAGFSLSQRSIDNPLVMTKGLLNIARHFVVDKGMNKLAGPGWKKWKEEQAVKRAEKALEEA